MKRTILTGLALVTGALATAAPAAAQAKIAYISSQRISAEATALTDARKLLEGEGQKYQTELQRLGAQLDSLQSAFEKQQSTMTAATKQQKQQEFQQRVGAAQKREAEIQQLMQKREQEVMAPVQQRILDAIEQVRKTGNYSIVLERSTLLAADPALDITDQVLTALKAAPAAKPAGGN